MINAGELPIIDGFVIDIDEMKRKTVILGLNEFGSKEYELKFGIKPQDDFTNEFELLLATSCLQETNGVFRLTHSGLKYRDALVQLFFSSKVRDLIQSYNY